MMVRWSLITAGAIALFWAIWYLATGSVPVTTSIKVMPDWTIQLPFGISRWWDILIGPIWSIIFIWIFTNERIVDKGGLVSDLAFILVVSLFFGLASGVPVSVVYGLAFGLVSFLTVCLASCLLANLPLLIKWICSKNFWKAVGNWLLAKNAKAERV